MTYRIRAGLVGLLIGSAFALGFSACGGLDKKQVLVHPDGTGETSSGGDAGSGDTTSNGGDAGSGATTSTGGDSVGGTSTGGTGTSGGDTGGDGGSAGEVIMLPPPVPGVPSVVSVSPGDKASGVDGAKVVTLTFSEALAPATVSTTSVQLKDSAGTVVPSAVAYAASAVTITPAARLHLLGAYTVNVSTAITGEDATPMAAAFASSFTVADGVWNKAEVSLTTAAGTFDLSGQVQIATDGGTHAIAVWTQTNTTTDLYASLYTQGTGWADPIKINLNVGTARYPYVSMNSSGNAIVSWEEYASPTYSVQARRYYGGVWDAASTRVDLPASLPTTTYTVYPSGYAVSITDKGDAHVAWYSYYYDSTTLMDYYGMYARHVNPTGAWDANVSTLQYSQLGGGLSYPSLAFDAAGNGFCAFQSTDTATPVKTSLVVERYVASTNKWGVSTVGSTPAGGYAGPVGVAVSPDGQAVISWLRNTTDTTYDMMGSYYNKAWSTPAVISNATTYVTLLAARPNAIVAWTGKSFWVSWAQSGGTPYNIYANEYKTGWGTPLILSDGNHSASSPFIAGDGYGNAITLWAQQSDTAATATVTPIDMAYSRLNGSTGKWSDPKLASSLVGGYRYPQIAFLGDGSAVASWQRLVHNGKASSVTGIFQDGFH